MKSLTIFTMSLVFLMSNAFAAEKKDTKKEKCVPSKEVVCKDSLKGKERPTPKKKKEEAK
jgi:hypothetical protein